MITNNWRRADRIESVRKVFDSSLFITENRPKTGRFLVVGLGGGVLTMKLISAFPKVSLTFFIRSKRKAQRISFSDRINWRRHWPRNRSDRKNLVRPRREEMFLFRWRRTRIFASSDSGKKFHQNKREAKCFRSMRNLLFFRWIRRDHFRCEQQRQSKFDALSTPVVYRGFSSWKCSKINSRPIGNFRSELRFSRFDQSGSRSVSDEFKALFFSLFFR